MQGLTGDTLLMARHIAKRARIEDLSTFKPLYSDMDFIGEPWNWLLAMVVGAPKRSAFILDEQENPGPWTTAFKTALEEEFYSSANARDISLMVKLFKRTAREYGAWRALGGTEAEGLRMLESLEDDFREARSIIAAWLRPRIAEATDEKTADAFAMNVAAADLRLPIFARQGLNTALRNYSKQKDNVTKDNSTKDKEGPQDAKASSLPPPILAGDQSTSPDAASKRQQKKKLRAAKWREFRKKSKKSTAAPAKKGGDKESTNPSPSRLQKARENQATADQKTPVGKKTRP